MKKNHSSFPITIALEEEEGEDNKKKKEVIDQILD